jgi:hypothetical protein
MRLAVSPADDGMVSLVERDMRSRNVPLPRNHKFLIAKRNDHWVVTVVDLEAVCRGERPRSSAYHVGERKGELRILYQEAGI